MIRLGTGVGEPVSAAELHLGPQTRVVGVIGDPIDHSLSPAMHNAGYEAQGLDFRYFAWHVRPEQLREALDKARALGVRGLNVTVPHKVAVLAYLDGVDPVATVIGAVNTVVFGDDGLVGYNTDADGFLDSLRDAGYDPRGERVVMLGAGGAARAIAVGLARAGVAQLTVVNRSFDRAESLTGLLASLGQGGLFCPEGLGSHSVEAAVGKASLVINATTVGLRGNGAVIPAALLKRGQFVADIVYEPLHTPFLVAARTQGCKVVTGDGMLLYQGARAYQLFTGVEAPVEAMRAALATALSARQEDFSSVPSNMRVT